MSAGPPIVVRYDVQQSDKVVSETKKVETSLNALRTSAGQTATSVKQMESGFNANALGNFSNAVTNADTKVGGFRTKLAGIGTAFSQNATSFGVATASIWGVYNAYDSLEKVQIRAHAAATRVSTLETTITTLTQRRAEAVAKGNLSAQEMAILDDRIANAHSKLAVAQERNADLQGDVNEAWAAFASQVGPQAIAAGGSIVQLVTGLRGSMGGVIPSIKNFFGSFAGGGSIMSATRQESLLLGQGIGNLKGPMEGAAVATRGLSTAMKGLLIGTGVGIAIAAIGLIAEHFMNTAEAAETSTSDIEDSMSEMDGSFTTSGGVVKTFGGIVHTTMDGAVIVVKSSADKIKENLSSLATELRNEFPNLTPEFIAGKNSEIESKLEQLRSRKSALQGGAAAGEGFRSASQEINSIDASIRTLNKDIADNKNLMNIMFGVASQGADDLRKVSVAADDMTGKIKTLINEGAGLSELFHIWQSGTLEETGNDALQRRYELFKQNFMTYQAGAKDEITTAEKEAIAQENLNIVLKAKAERFLESFNATNAATAAEEEQNRVEQEAIGIKKMIVEQTFGAALAAQQAGESNADYANRMTELSDIGQKRIDEEKAYALGLIDTAFQLGIAEKQQAALSTAIMQGNNAVIDLILSNETLAGVVFDVNNEQKLLNDGMIQGRMAAVSWYEQMVKQIGLNHQFEADQDIIYHKFADALPAGIELTKDQMTSLITTFNDAGDYGKAMGEVFDTVFSESRSALQELIDTATEGGKEWKDAWKDIKNTIPKNVRDDAKEFIDDQAEMSEKIDEIIPKLEIYRGIWDSLNKKEKSSATKDMADDIEKLGDQLDDVTDIDIESTIVDPLIKLKKDGLTKEEFNVWDGFFNLFAKLKKEGGGIDENDVKILQDYVANHTGMEDLSTATEDTTTAYDDLSDSQKEIADQRTLKATIDAQTGAFELQKTYVDALNLSLEHRAELINAENGGGGPTNVVFQDSTKIPFHEGVEPDKPEQKNIIIGADTEQFDTAIVRIKAEVTAIDALKPIIDFLGDHRQFMKAGSDVLNVVKGIDALRPIVDFLGDHSNSGNFMKAASDVLKSVAAIDKLRPIVDFMGDHSSSGNFMKAASEVIKKVKEIDGMVATVTIKAKRVGNFSAQHGMHAKLSEDSWIYAHKDERVDISPPSEHKSAFIPEGGGGGGNSVAGYGPIHIHAEIPLILGYDEVKKIVKDIYIENTGMFNT